MSIKIKPMLAFLLGILIFLLPISVQTTARFLPAHPEKSWGDETKNKSLPLDRGNSMRGLYDFWYRGF